MTERTGTAQAPKMFQPPSLGRLVHFYPGGAAGLECWSGVITAFKPNNVINVHVFGDAENGYPKGGDGQRDVPLAQPGMTGRRWEWPPFVPPVPAEASAPADPAAPAETKPAETAETVGATG